jgi:pullulanase
LVLGADGLHRLTLNLAAGMHELKVASEDWSAIDWGQAVHAEPLPGRGNVLLAGAGRNIALKLDKAARCTFTLDGRDIVEPRLSVDCAAP